MWQRLETSNPYTQYKPHNDANRQWAKDAHEVPTYSFFFFFFIKLSRLEIHLEVTPITPTSKKNETARDAKGKAKRGKTKIVGVYTKNLTDPNTKP